MTATTSRGDPVELDEPSDDAWVAAKRACQIASLRITERSRPATSSPGRSQRPSAGFAPSTDMSSAETRVVARRIGSPSPVSVSQWPSAYAATSSARTVPRISASPPFGYVPVTLTRRDGSGYGSGERRMPSTRL